MKLLLLCLLSICLHECGHILAAAIFNLRVKQVGIAKRGFFVRRETSRNPWHEVAIRLAGVAVNLCLWMYCSGDLASFNKWMIICNLLLPHSDGWRAWEALRITSVLAAFQNNQCRATYRLIALCNIRNQDHPAILWAYPSKVERYQF
jgi:hypothetical protein